MPAMFDAAIAGMTLAPTELTTRETHMSGIGGLDQSRLAMAVLAACFARTLGEQDSTFERRLRKQIERMSYRLQDAEAKYAGVLETLHWFEEFLKDPAESA